LRSRNVKGHAEEGWLAVNPPHFISAILFREVKGAILEFWIKLVMPISLNLYKLKTPVSDPSVLI
jgi:hypothetical protein